MSINHLIYSQAVPKYDIYCNNIDVAGDVTNVGVISTPELYAQNAFVSSNVQVGGNLIMTQDKAGTEALLTLPYLDSFGASDGFGGLAPTEIIAYTVKKTLTPTSIIREYTFNFFASSLVSPEFKINFLPIGYETASSFNVTNLDFKVIDSTAGATIAPKVAALNATTLTISSLLVVGAINAGNKAVYISITTSEDN